MSQTTQGIQYFLTHGALRKPLFKVAVPATLLTLGVLGGVFALLYLLQVAVLAVVNGPVAFVNAALLCLNESAFLVNVVARAFLLEDALLAVFDAVSLSRHPFRIVRHTIIRVAHGQITLTPIYIIFVDISSYRRQTLIEKGQQHLVEQGREIKGGGTGKSSITKLGKLITKPLSRFSPVAIIEYLCFLPLNAIPVIGTAAFVVVQGAYAVILRRR